jgi:hypothetical protein
MNRRPPMLPLQPQPSYESVLPPVPQHPVDLDALEDEIKEMTGNPARRLSPVLPDAQPEADIGRLSADAVLEQFKMAAKSVEEMGEEIQARIRALEGSLKECDADMKLLAEAAVAIREKGKLAHAEIERTAAVSKDIREIVAAIKNKLT